MRTPFFSTTYSKLIATLLLNNILLVVIFLAIVSYINKEEDLVYKTSSKEYNSEINTLLPILSSKYVATLIDITVWDKFVDFFSTKDSKWYLENVESGLSVYDVDYLAAYDVNGEFIIHSNNSKISSNNFIPKEVINDLVQDKYIHYYERIPEGIIEVFGATVHPAFDPDKNSSNPAGCFFMVRLLDKAFINEAGQISRSKLDYINLNKIIRPSEKNLIATVELNRFNNRPLGKFMFTRDFGLRFHNSKYLLQFMLLFLLGSFVINFFVIRQFIYFPLSNIKRILEKNDSKSIDDLKKSHGEFSYIGKMFENNILQELELRDALSKAEESDKLKTSFLQNMSHEIRTPMNAIMGFTDLLQDDNLSIDERKEYLNVISKSGSNLLLIIQDLIDMSKIDAKLVSPNLTNFDMNKIILELYESIKITIPKSKNVDFILIEPEYPFSNKIISDETKLKQIITNLTTNALKFTNKGHVSITYKVNPSGNTFIIEVIDTGIGIEPQFQKLIFDRFRQVENKNAVSLGGLGLGLAISKAYVDMLGGVLTVESTIGMGSKFTLEMPLLYATSQINTESFIELKINPKLAAEKTILIAEDDNINYLLISKYFKDTNHNIIRASDGEEVIEIMNQNDTIDLILMDIKMPKLNGFEAYKFIKNKFPDIPVIAQTAYATAEDKLDISQAGFIDYLSKPIEKKALNKILDKYLN